MCVRERESEKENLCCQNSRINACMNKILARAQMYAAFFIYLSLSCFYRSARSKQKCPPNRVSSAHKSEMFPSYVVSCVTTFPWRVITLRFSFPDWNRATQTTFSSFRASPIEIGMVATLLWHCRNFEGLAVNSLDGHKRWSQDDRPDCWGFYWGVEKKNDRPKFKEKPIWLSHRDLVKARDENNENRRRNGIRLRRNPSFFSQLLLRLWKRKQISATEPPKTVRNGPVVLKFWSFATRAKIKINNDKKSAEEAAHMPPVIKDIALERKNGAPIFGG